MNAAMKSARTSGELARQAGRLLSANPYRQKSSTRSPRRGSWSEAFARQWALGWQEVDQRLTQEPEPAVAGAVKEVPTPAAPSSGAPSMPATKLQTSQSPKGDPIHG